MDYNILVTGKSTFVVDFIAHAPNFFTCMSTSIHIKDIVNHYKLFEPDAFIMFVEEDNNNTSVVSTINNLKDYTTIKEAPIVIVGKPEICEDIQKLNPYIADMFVQRPISADNLSLKVTRYLEKLEEEKRLAEEAAKAQENVEEAAQDNTEENIPETPPADAEQTVNARKQLLIVDDDRNMLKMLKAALSDNYDVTTMVNGVLVEKFLETKTVDLIILDHEMPVTTGAEIFKKLKENPNSKNIPVCFLTGVSERSKIEEIMKLKPHGYLLKPISMDMLISTINNLTS